ncbi:uncharacterized protein LOC113210160 [Frankliniella occidentalis]|uniref:Uncharacterized protein LOC113210160 n=1 Tax=Frankliniella occidentalis TaxID=133901 RepID=A0A6J1SSE8_FRAOC|nr:uncharacterized protein LOC113210160 [Frankliniella occidentalis]
MSTKQLTLQQLPDDVLVLMMQHLAVDDLFACRLVCRRLRDLALHPEIWSHRRLDEDKPCVCAVLGLAPCLDRAVYSKKVHTRAFTMTRCAVRHLTLRVRQGTECARACIALLRQEVLGRLKSVQLHVSYSLEDVAPVAPLEDADALLGTLVACRGLESLDLTDSLPEQYVMRPVLHGPSRSSLKYFRCYLSEETATFVNTVLAGHAATLQEVDFGCQYFEEEGTFQPFVGLSVLRRLTCTVFTGMQALASCKMLTAVSLSLFEDYTPESVVQGAVEFLRLLAGQLRTVSLEFQYADGDNEHFDRLLRALACSGESLVEQLTILTIPIGAPLLRALPRLPALRVLSVLKSPLVDPEDDDCVGDILAGITPATAPSLRRLELSTSDLQGCLHEWLHRDAVGRVLAANPSLHVHVWGTRGCRGGGPCEACALGCHREAIRDFKKGRRVGLFSHGPGECTHPEDHITGDKWTWIHFYCNSD